MLQKLSWHPRIARIIVARASIDASLGLYAILGIMRLIASHVRRNQVLNIHRGENPRSRRIFPVIEFKVASLDRSLFRKRISIKFLTARNPISIPRMHRVTLQGRLDWKLLLSAET